MDGIKRFKKNEHPWKVGTAIDLNALAVFPKYVQAGEVCKAICLISPLDELTKADEANADLIAAAPLLFEALKNIMEVQDGWLKDHYPALYNEANTALEYSTWKVNEKEGQS